MPDGRRPSTREQLIAESAKTLAPHQSLDRIDKTSGTVTAAVTLAGTLAGVFGLVAATTLASVGIGWALPTVILAAISIACAILATVPAPGKVAPGDLFAVERFFRGQIRKRGLLVRGAAWALAVAVLLAPLPMLAAALANDGPAIDLTVAVNGESRRVVVGVAATGLPEGAVVTATVQRAGRTIAFAATDAGPNGKLTSTVTAPAVPAGTKLMVTATGPKGTPARAQNITVPAAS
ncbi:MAG: hypothetical protein ACLP01_10045 [Solirubrobacteraceae bacterium]